ncbi:MAG: alpha/beta hydrolase [Pseudomonadota bacterium]
MRTIVAIACLVLTSCSAQEPPLMTWDDLTSRPLPQPTETRRYRDGPSGVIDLWLPEGEGPHPVVVMIHGGCWQKSIADRTLMNYAADALRDNGLAVWNIEYRGVDEEGGGYPGTFQDVAAAIDLLGEEADDHDISLRHVLSFGHSAGGHLAVWAASRRNISQESALYTDRIQPIDVVINSGGLADLEVSSPVTLRSCLANIEEQLVGTRPEPYADTSPAELLPPSAIIYNVNGARDSIAPPVLGETFTTKINTAGGSSTFRLVEGAGHVELIAPGTKAFEIQSQILVAHALSGMQERD